MKARHRDALKLTINGIINTLPAISEPSLSPYRYARSCNTGLKAFQQVREISLMRKIQFRRCNEIKGDQPSGD